jgi:hypothetical protein
MRGHNRDVQAFFSAFRGTFATAIATVTVTAATTTTTTTATTISGDRQQQGHAGVVPPLNGRKQRSASTVIDSIYVGASSFVLLLALPLSIGSITTATTSTSTTTLFA